MRFVPTDEQRDFGSSLEKLLSASDTVAVTRAWGRGETESGLKLWSRLAEQGVNALLVPEESGGMGATPVEMTIAFEALGRHAVPGPWVESAAYLPRLLSDETALGELAEGAVGTVAVAPQTPYALDADVAAQVYAVSGDQVSTATVGERKQSVDLARRLFTVTAGESVGTAANANAAYDAAVLATSAQLLGCGERLLADTVTYVKQRRQFGREIGSYQALKHQLADVRIALDFARPLIQGAALTLDTAEGSRDVSAAKIASAEAAYLASRVGLQLHGAIGFTQEFDLSIWILKVRALVNAWGTPAVHRARVLAALVDAKQAV